MKLSLVTNAAYLMFILSIAAINDQVAPGDEPTGTSPVVVELFTSEGCSSCPPADKLLMTLSSKDTLVLSFHVDYWNQLGWCDPFSNPDFTVRQHQYGKLLGLNQVYTPQMVVGGEVEFVGSNKKSASEALANAKRNQAPELLSLTVMKQDNRVQIAYELATVQKGELLNLALVQKSASSKVTAGENARANLDHVNVVRTFKTLTLDSAKSGIADLALPSDVKPNELFVAGYVQVPATGKIGTATQQPIP